MNTRRGFTLVELLIVMVMLALIGAALTKILVNSMRVSAGQMVQAEMQANVRTGGLVLPLELREVGFDSNITTGELTSDLEQINASYIQFRAGRGFGATCDLAADLKEFRIRKPAYGMRAPQITDGFMVYVENDPNQGADDQWVPLVVTAINPDGLCGTDPAYILTTATPTVSPLGVAVTAANVFVGGPIRFYEVMRFGSFVDTDGLTYLGARSISAGEASYKAVAGPIAAANGVEFRYYDRNTTQLDASIAAPITVRSIEVLLTGSTRTTATLAGTLPRGNRTMFTQTRVALRNTLRH
ncbi:MAG TPA: type II secretion system protein [Gemmatimonadales bacterium]|nr:type II secretion system protein [Gemmatimonadales bacterium]